MTIRKRGVTITANEGYGFIKVEDDTLRWFYHVADSNISQSFPVGTQVEFTPEYTRNGKHLRAVLVEAM